MGGGGVGEGFRVFGGPSFCHSQDDGDFLLSTQMEP